MKGTMTIRIDDVTKGHIVKEAKKLYSTPSRLAYEILKQRYDTNPSSKTTRVTQKSNNPIGIVKKGSK